MTLGDLLNTLAAKIGLQNEPALIDLLSSADLAKHEVSDDLAQRFDTGLMSLDGAKNNRDVLASLKAFYLSQGATVEPATDDEVFAAEPAYRPAPPTPDYPAEIARLQHDIDQ